MSATIHSYKSLTTRPMVVGTTLGLSFWAFRSAFTACLFGQGEIWRQLFTPDFNEFCLRSVVVCLLVAFSAYAEVLMGRRMERPRREGEPLPPASLKGLRDEIIATVRQRRVPFRNPVAEALLQAERQRVMMESVGAACHHLSQPLFVLLGTLEMMQGRGGHGMQEQPELVERSLEAARRLTGVVRKLQQIRDYRTVPYIEGQSNILDIGLDPESAQRAA